MRRTQWWLLDRMPPPAGHLVPPARLRFKVSEDAGAARFIEVGRQAAQNLMEALNSAHFALDGEAGAGRAVLDFGCGCGRTLAWLCERFPQAAWYGADVDAEAIDWCRRRFPRATFAVNAPLPPLAFPDAHFDLIYAVSVFTHLSESYQQAWLADLFRLLRPGGLLLLSFYSRQVWETWEDAGAVEAGAFVFRTSAKWKGLLPDWYQTALQSEQRIVRGIEAAGFQEVVYTPRRLGDQDLASARKPGK